MKNETFRKLYEDALIEAEKEKSMNDEVEVVLVPIIVCKNNGKIGSISGVNTKIIFNENHL